MSGSGGIFQSSEAAAAAAEFNDKTMVWVPDTAEGYLPGWVLEEVEDYAKVEMAPGGQYRNVPTFLLSRMNPPKFDRVEDLASLTFLNEASLVHNLRLRYGSGAIYTYSGIFLIAINPYQALPLYSDAIIHQYRGKRRDENPPHIFAIAEKAWVNMGEERENQSILITGESGAGKTESTKKVIQYLAAIATDAHPPSSSHSRSNTSTSMPTTGLPRSNSIRRTHIAPAPTGGSQLKSRARLGLLEQQILQANPILESFGNAQTQRNNNSSRFGKFVRVMFSPDGSIAGASIDWYLLEKSRVVVRNEAERSFHIFYQLLVGADPDLRESLLLNGEISDYEYLNKSRREVDGINDREEWRALRGALDLVGIDAATQFDLFRVVSAILNIGNIKITSSGVDDSQMPDPSQAERVCHLLGIPITDFMRAVLRPRAIAGKGEWVTQTRTKQQAIDELAALCKTLYEKTFSALVDRINLVLDRPSSKSTFIGVLDIAGFEIFDINGYEQLLINFTNEKLQQFFNHHMFVLEQEEYSREGIKWESVNFGLDLQPTIELIESNGPLIGILSCLDEECIMPKASDATFTHKLNTMWGGPLPADGNYHLGREKYGTTRFDQGFVIQHYAARVEYRTEGWLEKNKDPLNDDLSRVLAASSDRFIANLFIDFAEPSGVVANIATFGKKRGVKKGAFRTVAQRHKEQLSNLMTQLRATQPHFVRCIVPNTLKKPGRIDVPLVLDQLRCNGVLEGIRISRLGYPNRLPFVEFRYRYEILTPGIIPKGYMDGREASRRMVNALELDDSIYKIGTSKIFFKTGVLAELEERRDELLYDIFSRIQAAARMWHARRQMKKILNRAVALRTLQRNARAYAALKDWPWWQLYTKVRPLLAATRNDEELRRKDLELALANERAERDKQEREALESLKATLEAEKRKVEDELEAERALVQEKHATLERYMAEHAELEERCALQEEEIATLDGHLDSAMRLQKESEEKREQLRKLFDEAAAHIDRLQQERKEWESEEGRFTGLVHDAEKEIDSLRLNLATVKKEADELRALVRERDEDLIRLKDRMESAMADLRAQMEVELQNKEILKDKSVSLEDDTRRLKEQLDELGRTAADYGNIIQRKESQLAELTRELERMEQENREARLEVMALKTEVDTTLSQLEAEKRDHAQSVASKDKLQREMDELRKLMETKASEETRRREVEKSREIELADLRRTCEEAQQTLADVRLSNLETQNKLKLDLEVMTREYLALERSHKSLLDRERAAQSQLVKTQNQLADLEKSKRTLNSELESAKSHHHESQQELAELEKNTDILKRQLSAAESAAQSMEDEFVAYKRDRDAEARRLQDQLDAEVAKRTQVEKSNSSNKAELAKYKERASKAEKDLDKALTDLKAREWEVKQLESKQDKTIVEHVHVLEEAKRVTDRQLADAQAELLRNQSLIRSLRAASSKMTSETEYMLQKHQDDMREKEHRFKARQTEANRAIEDLAKERKAKEEAHLQISRLQTEVHQLSSINLDLKEQLAAAQSSKNKLSDEIETLARGPENDFALAKLQRQAEDADLQKANAARALSTVDEHRVRLDKMVSSARMDSTLREQILNELRSIEETVRAETVPNTTRPTSIVKKSVAFLNHRSSMSISPPTSAQSNKQIAELTHQVKSFETQVSTSEKTMKHLENSIRHMTELLETFDGSDETLRRYKSRLAAEETQLSDLLRADAGSRKTSKPPANELHSAWTKLQRVVIRIQEEMSTLEASRKGLIAQQRTDQKEVDAQRDQLRQAQHERRKYKDEAKQLHSQLESAKADVAFLKQELDKRSQMAQSTHTNGSDAQSEDYKLKEQVLEKRMKNAENAKLAAENSEKHIRETLSVLEMAQDGLQKELRSAKDRIRDLESELRDRQDREIVDTSSVRRRLEQDLAGERERYLEMSSEFEQRIDKMQNELATARKDVNARQSDLLKLRAENEKLHSELDGLQGRYDHELHNNKSWKKEKERLESKVKDLDRSLQSSKGTQKEQQAQIVSLHSQVRELRTVLDEAESDRTMLQKARRALQAELETIKVEEHGDASGKGSDKDAQRRQKDSEREDEQRIARAEARRKAAEASVHQYELEVERLRAEKSGWKELEGTMETQIKEHKLRIAELESRSYGRSPRPSLNNSSRRLDEIAAQLTGPDSYTQNAEIEKAQLKIREYENQMTALRNQILDLNNRESRLESGRRKAERDARDAKERMESLERELEHLQGRPDRPRTSSAHRSVTSTPTRR